MIAVMIGDFVELVLEEGLNLNAAKARVSDLDSEVNAWSRVGFDDVVLKGYNKDDEVDRSRIIRRRTVFNVNFRR